MGWVLKGLFRDIFIVSEEISRVFKDSSLLIYFMQKILLFVGKRLVNFMLKVENYHAL